MWISIYSRLGGWWLDIRPSVRLVYSMLRVDSKIKPQLRSTPAIVYGRASQKLLMLCSLRSRCTCSDCPPWAESKHGHPRVSLMAPGLVMLAQGIPTA